MLVQDLISFLEESIPLAYQESYDNAGLQCGDPDAELHGVLICLDVSDAIIEEAIRKNCNFILAHHPPIFKGLKKIQKNTRLGSILYKAMVHDISIYAAHTNYDHLSTGVNAFFAKHLGLEKCKILVPKSELIYKLELYCPVEVSSRLAKALYEAGAGKIGLYSDCSFETLGKGHFTPSAGSNPLIGQILESTEVNESKLEFLVSSMHVSKVIKAMYAHHPYEEVAYFLIPTQNIHQEIGAGMMGYLPVPQSAKVFLEEVKENFQAKAIKYKGDLNKKVHKVAICGGAGIFLLQAAKKAGADIFITSDCKYHDFFDHEGEMILADIGHYESEQFTLEGFFNLISKKFTNIAVLLTETNTNPVQYLI